MSYIYAQELKERYHDLIVIDASEVPHNEWLEIIEEKDSIKDFFDNELCIDMDDKYAAEDVGPGIPENDFVAYAQEYAEDIGAVSESDNWPNRCIDWEKAAEELAQDYNLVEWEGFYYYFLNY